MIAISIRFIGGRFHATPWGRHVNEGVAEWPPSPWRFLRALIATWKLKLDKDITTSEVEAVLRTLAETPTFVLPPATVGHWRQFMPWYKKGPADRTLIFDSFVVCDPSACLVTLWQNAILDHRQHFILGRLLENMGSLGRAESWCEAQILREPQAISLEPNCIPLEQLTESHGYEITRVLCADPETAFADDHVTISVKPKRARGNISPSASTLKPRYDPSWHLCIETAQLHAERWSDPPGSKWVRYARRNDCFRVEPRKVYFTPKTPPPQVARFALHSAVLPLLTETLPLAEAARFTLMGIFGRRNPGTDGSKGKSHIFSGKNAEGIPLLQHEHAYYLPTDEDNDGKLDHLTIFSREGFGPGELKSLDLISEIRARGEANSRHPLRVILQGLGRLEDYHPIPVGPATQWVSATPFIVTRHPKRRGTKRDAPELYADITRFTETVLREELGRWFSSQPAATGSRVENIRIVPILDDQGVFRLPASHLRPIQFKRFRKKSGDDGGRRASGFFQLTFEQPMQGPICLGHSSHFGMGLFLPISNTRP